MKRRRPNLLRIVLGVPVLIVLLSGLGVCWIGAYQCQDPALLAKLRKDARARAEERDRASQEPSRNGYDDLVALLGNGEDDKVDCLATLAFCRPALESRRQTLPQVLNSPELRDVLARYEATLPRQYAALARPDFLWDSAFAEKAGHAPLPLRALRHLVSSAVVYADVLRLQHREGEALDHLLRYYQLGGKIYRQGELQTLMLGMSVQSIAYWPIVELINSGHLDAAQLKRALATVQAIPPVQSVYAERMEEDFAILMDSAEAQAAHEEEEHDDGHGHDKQPLAYHVMKYSGWLERERRVMQDFHLKLRDRYRTLELLEDTGVRSTDYTEKYAIDHHNQSILTLMPNCASSIAFVAAAATREGALQVLLALQAYRLEHGSYPTALAQLVPEQLPVLPRDWCSANGEFLYARSGDDFRLSSQRREAALRALRREAPPFRPTEASDSAP